MRQIGILPERTQASRLAAYLITENISCEAEEEEDGSWSIWVHDENHIDVARDKLEAFRENPDASEYQGREAQADQMLKQEQQRRIDAQRNTVDVRTKWAQPPGSKSPFVMTLIILSVVVTFFVGLGGRGSRPSGLQAQVRDHMNYVSAADYAPKGDSLASVKQGQLWRLITPIFPHGDIIHLVFNMFMLYQFGRLLEMKLGAPKLALLVLFAAVVSNTAQATTPESLQEIMGRQVNFLGMSGVVYGLFGYAWIRSQLDPSAGYYIPPMLVFMMLGWMLLCMTPAIKNIANMAHVAGLVAGIAAAQIR